MYEASFGLKRRPFAATPDASCYLSSDPILAALDEIVVCVEHGQGIAVLTAPAGTGKTLLCERLRCELDERYETVFLRHSSFLTRRALLQTVLCELNSPYHHPSEQELRLELLPAIRALQPKREALVLICDEAHQLSDSLLEELRILADFAESGRPLVRLVLVGQLSLEEKLAHPSLDAFNQRIRAHVSLSSFDHAGSLDYIDYRLTWAGGRTIETFTPQALDLIAKVSDGIPRCINQLADHALLLAFVAEQRPAGEELVREALSDLRQLPLHWNEPPQSLLTDYSSPVDIDDRSSPFARTPDQNSTEVLDDLTTSTTCTNKLDTDCSNRDPYQDRSTEPVANTSSLTSYEYATFESSTLQQTNLSDMSIDDWRHTLELFDSSIPNRGFVDSYSQQLVKPTHHSDEFDRIKDVDQIPFPELLHETVLSLANNAKTEFTEEHFVRRESADNLTPVQSFWNSQDAMLKPTENKSNQSVTSNSSNELHSVSGFQEEIVVDRYAAIDAGLEPPVSSPLDTSNLIEVHSKQGSIDQYSLLNMPLEIAYRSAADRIDSNSEILKDFDGQERPAWEGTFALSANGPVPDAVSNQDQAIETAAADVDAIDSTPQPSEVGDLSSESLIQAIRREVDQLASSVGRKSDSVSASDSQETSWESVETPQPEQKTESRPFQYLFSKLRRKQQGLS